MVDTDTADLLRNTDHPVFLVTRDENLGFPIVLGFNCGSEDGGGLLSLLDSEASDQMALTREQLEWLRDVGIPAWLADPEAQAQA